MGHVCTREGGTARYLPSVPREWPLEWCPQSQRENTSLQLGGELVLGTVCLMTPLQPRLRRRGQKG